MKSGRQYLFHRLAFSEGRPDRRVKVCLSFADDPTRALEKLWLVLGIWGRRDDLRENDSVTEALPVPSAACQYPVSHSVLRNWAT